MREKRIIPFGVKMPPFEHTGEGDCPLCMFLDGVEAVMEKLKEMGRPAVRHAEFPDGTSTLMTGVDIFIPDTIPDESKLDDLNVFAIRVGAKGGDT